MKTESTFRILVNSMPKSGTFLLCRAIDLLGFQNVSRGLLRRIANKMGLGLPPSLIHETIRRHWRQKLYKRFGFSPNDTLPIGVTSPIQVPSKLLIQWLQSVPLGHYITGHVPWSATMEGILRQLGYKHILIIRDPRDVLVSFLHYVLRPEHDLNEDFKSLSKDERVGLAIKGGYVHISSRHVLGIGEAFRSVINWKQSQNCFIVRFEDLVGEKGGSSKDVQYKTIERMCDYLGLNKSVNIINQICEQIFDITSPTFRRGKIGSWKSELSHEWVRIFNEQNIDLLNESHYDA